MNRATRLSGVVVLAGGLLGTGGAGAITLEDAVRLTLGTNPEIQGAVSERLSRDEEIKQARAGYFPTVDVNAGIGWEQTDNVTIDDEELTRRELGVNVRQMLFDGFATRNEVVRQQARVSSAAYTVQGTAQDTALKGIEAYIEVAKQRALLDLAQENLAAHQRIYDQVKLRSESGVGRKADLDQIEGRWALARSNVIASEVNLRDASTSYLRVVGWLPEEELVRPAVPAGVIPDNIMDVTAEALANHPTLRSAAADVDAAMAQNETSKHRFYPRFDIELGGRWDEDIDGVEGDDDELQAMLRMRWNVFNGGADQARTRQTAHLVNEAKAVRDDTHRQVEESVRFAWNSYLATRNQREYLQRHMESSIKTREAYAKQFNIGQRTLLDLLDTENEVFESSRAFVAADYVNLYAQYRLLVGMGKLFDTLAIALPAEAAPPNP